VLAVYLSALIRTSEEMPDPIFEVGFEPIVSEFMSLRAGSFGDDDGEVAAPVAHREPGACASRAGTAVEPEPSGDRSGAESVVAHHSDLGGHWIHDVNVINAAAEIGEISGRNEAFPVQIASVQLSKPEQNGGNVIERVYMSRHFGNVCTAIAVANATAEVRNNLVDGYQIGYGGWDLHDTVFHDNTAVNTEYGFNIDSLANSGVRIERNKILNPRKYGIVIGGEGTFAGFKFLNNVIQLDKPGTFGFVFNGNVTGAAAGGRVAGWFERLTWLRPGASDAKDTGR
jgi:hypothetical protein